jgi:hypothetical protein
MLKNWWTSNYEKQLLSLPATDKTLAYTARAMPAGPTALSSEIYQWLEKNCGFFQGDEKKQFKAIIAAAIYTQNRALLGNIAFRFIEMRDDVREKNQLHTSHARFMQTQLQRCFERGVLTLSNANQFIMCIKSYEVQSVSHFQPNFIQRLEDCANPEKACLKYMKALYKSHTAAGSKLVGKVARLFHKSKHNRPQEQFRDCLGVNNMIVLLGTRAADKKPTEQSASRETLERLCALAQMSTPTACGAAISGSEHGLTQAIIDCLRARRDLLNNPMAGASREDAAATQVKRGRAEEGAAAALRR